MSAYRPWPGYQCSLLELDFQGTRLEFQGCKCMCSVCWDTIQLEAPLEPGFTWVHQIPEFDFGTILGQKVPFNLSIWR